LGHWRAAQAAIAVPAPTLAASRCSSRECTPQFCDGKASTLMARWHATAHGRDERHIASVIFNYKLELLSLESTAPASTPIPSPPPEVGAVIISPAAPIYPVAPS
jgi:hypothetical protein